MKHLLRRVLPMLAIGALVSFAAPTPAQAHTDSCTGQFTITTGGGLGLPSTNNSVSFTISMTLGVCTSGASFSAAGTFTGACLVGSGAGITNTGHNFVMQLGGTTAAFTGQVNGVLDILPDPTAGSCTNQTATRFLATGTLLLSH